MIKSVSYDQLNPVSFLDRSSFVYPDKEAVIYKDQRYTYSEFAVFLLKLPGLDFMVAK